MLIPLGPTLLAIGGLLPRVLGLFRSELRLDHLRNEVVLVSQQLHRLGRCRGPTALPLETR
jgi:hypothetical protein